MKYGELKNHFSHPSHTLHFQHSEQPFTCDGCRQVGIGSRFTCSICDFDLHTHCASANPASSTLHHPFYPKCSFIFFSSPPGNGPHCCNSCGLDTPGFVYHCADCGCDLHPCCAAFPHFINIVSGLRLQLHHRTSAPCHRCGWKGDGWSYRSDCKKYNLHIACGIEMWLEKWRERSYGCGSSSGIGGMLGNRLPITRAARNSHRSWKGKVKKCCKLAAMAAQFVIAAVFGDPTALIAGIVSSFLSQ